MTENNIFKIFLKYTSFNVLGMIALSCYIFADTLFISMGIGIDGLTAINLALPIFSLVNGSGLMIGMGGGTKYTLAVSRGKQQEGNKIFTNTLYMTAIFGIVFVILGIFFSGNIATLLGADEQVMANTEIYLKMLLIFSPAFILNNIVQCFVRNDGAPHLSMIAMIVGSMSNMFLDWLFIFSFGMGMFGAVLATCLSPVFSLILTMQYFIRKKNTFHVVKTKISGKAIGGIIASGFPSFLTEISTGIVLIVFNFLFMEIAGNTGVAAYGVIANLWFIVVSMFTGISQGMQPIMSHNYGKGKYGNVNKILKYGLILMGTFAAAIYAVMFFGSEYVAAIFNSEHNETLQYIAEEGLKLYYIACPFVGFNIIISIFFTSTEYPVPAHIISILRGFALIIPMAFIMLFAGGRIGLWMAFPVTEMIVTVIGIILYIMRNRKLKEHI